MSLPQACVMKVQMGSERMDQEFKTAWPLIHQSLHCGDSVLVHCMAGKHRAPACTALIYALMMGTTVDEAAEKITKMRPCVEFHKFCRDRTAAQWLYTTRRTLSLPPVHPKPAGYLASERSSIHLCTEGRVALCQFKQGEARVQQRLKDAHFYSSFMEASTFARPVCGPCWSKAPASWQARH